MIEIEMQYHSFLITKAVDCWEDLKQELVFIVVSEQRWAKRITILLEVKESNMAIKKEMIICKFAWNVYVHGDNKNEEMSGTLRPTKNKNIFSHDGATTFTSHYVFIDENDLALDAEWYAYKTTLIASSHDWRCIQIETGSLVLHVRTWVRIFMSFLIFANIPLVHISKIFLFF